MKEIIGHMTEKKIDKHWNWWVTIYSQKCTTKRFTIRPIKNEQRNESAGWIVKLERNSFGNHVPGLHTISMRDREKIQKSIEEMLGKILKNPKEIPRKIKAKTAQDTLGKVDNLL